MITIEVRGVPAPQGSKRAIRHKVTGKPIVIESSGDRLAFWRRAVTEAAYQATIGHPALGGPVRLAALFSFRRPKSHYRTGRNNHLLRDGAPAEPCGKHEGDLSHLMRAVEDALTDAGAWGDDSQVCRYGEPTGKVWCGSPGALDVPGAVISWEGFQR